MGGLLLDGGEPTFFIPDVIKHIFAKKLNFVWQITQKDLYLQKELNEKTTQREQYHKKKSSAKQRVLMF